ncbi:hypothetical protein ACFW04_013502 [Cataglyphis niger]
MPNLRGPDEKRQRLYGNVVLSVILYGAPVWGDVVETSKKLNNLVSLQRSLAQRIVSSYRIVSGDVACLLARLPLIVTSCQNFNFYFLFFFPSLLNK